jgi:hypothetical protein
MVVLSHGALSSRPLRLSSVDAEIMQLCRNHTFLEEFRMEWPALTLGTFQDRGTLSRREIGSTGLRRALHGELFPPDG